MDMTEHLQRLFNYDAWANAEVVASLERMQTAPPRCITLLSHILSAEKLWLERLLGQEQTLPVWPELTLPQCKLEAAELPLLYRRYVASSDEASLSQSISYKNSKGEIWTSTREDILLHVIMHSAYHRGQIAAEVRASGFAPAYTDFIHAVRQGCVE
jgi:uncharacterized damage-inducible protein DinB